MDGGRFDIDIRAAGHLECVFVSVTVGGRAASTCILGWPIYTVNETELETKRRVAACYDRGPDMLEVELG